MSGDDDTLAAPAGGPAPAPELGVVERRHYEILVEHARGGLGRIVRARDRRTGRVVALKEMLRPGGELEARFAREALVTANLQHPAIVPVYEVGRWPSGEPFFAMKLVSGRSLEDRVAETRTLAERLALLGHVIDVAEALAYAHAEGVIHRDLKPANVLVGSYGETVVIDWGLAKEGAGDDGAPGPLSGGESETVVGTVMGTPAYMPPEQARGETVDARADVYAIGALLYHVLAGERPYAEVGAGIVEKVLAGPPRPLGESVPAELTAIVARAMARRAEDRYPTAKELADDLNRFQTGKLVQAHAYSAGELLRRWVRRHRGPLVTGAVALAALAALAVVSVRRVILERNRAEAAVAELFAEQGRQLVVAGEPQRALPSLIEARARGAGGAALDFLLARALEPTGNLSYAAPPAAERIFAASFSPDGKSLLAASGDMVVRVLDAATGRVRITVPFGMVAWWSPDGKEVLSIMALGEVHVWDGATGRLTRRVGLPRGEPAIAATWLPRGGFAVGGWRGTVGVWGDDQPPLFWPAGEAVIRGVVPYAGGLRVFSDDKKVRGFGLDGSGGELVAEVAGDGAYLGFRPDGEPVPPSFLDGQIARVAFRRDAGGMATAAKGGTITLRDADGRALAFLGDHAGPIGELAFSPDGTRLVSGGHDGRLLVWRTAHESPLALVGSRGTLSTAVFSPDGRLAAVASEDGQARLYDARDGELTATLSGHDGAVRYASFSPDAARVVTAGADGTVRVWDRKGQLQLTIPHGEPVRRAFFAPDGRRVLATGADLTALYDATTGARLAALDQHLGKVTSARFSPDGARIVVCTDAVVTHLWDGEGRAIIETVSALGPMVYDVTFSPDGRRFALLSNAVRLRVFDSAGGALVATLAGHTAAVTGAEFSPDGARIATAGEDGSVRLWRVDDGALIATLVDGAGVIPTVRFRPDGALIAAAGVDGTLRVWDAATHRPLLARAMGHPLYLLRWAPGGDRLLLLGDAPEPWLVDAGATGGDVATLRRRLACVSPWKVEGTALVAAVPDAAACR